MDRVVIYHNPRCSKSRKTLELLSSRGFEPEIVEYLKTPPSVQQLESLIAKLGLTARELMRTHEESYARLGLDEVTNESDLIRAMHEHPELIERPIVMAGAAARIGRPPEAILEIL